MVIWLLAALIIAIVSCIFALQNAVPMTLTFMRWHFQGSIALVVLSALALGALMGFLVTLPAVFRRSWIISGLKRKMSEADRQREESPAPPVPR